ncbi:MAG: DUF3656 domain-containing protein [Phycisphaerae bacterium]
MRKLELLCPAGDFESMKAAVANGADAVYFGLPAFNARARAANFALDELPRAVAYLHGRNVRAYVALNTLTFADELPEASRYVAAVADAGADAVIVQDIGLARLVHRMCPTLAIHASTQMTLTEPRGIGLVEGLGVRRVILARELAVEDITAIARACPVELEVFVHGAMCISFSGQCLASETFWKRSGNRGLCGQACRLPYRLVVDGALVSGAESGRRKFPLSPRDLRADDLVAELADAGVTGLKIEGRLKGATYAAATAQVYRAAIDAAAVRADDGSGGAAYVATEEQEENLAMSFSRGFSHGFLRGVDHQRLVEGLWPASRGVRIGTVVAISPRGVVVKPDECVSDAPGTWHGHPAHASPGHLAPAPPETARGQDALATHGRDARATTVAPGDGVVFQTGQEDKEDPGGRVFSVASRGDNLELTFSNDLDLSAVTAGSIVWKTDDPPIRRRLESSFARDIVAHPAPLAVTVLAIAGRPLCMDFHDDRGNSVAVESAEPLAPATKHPLTVGLLRDQLGRLGGTPFRLEAVALAGPDGPAASVAVMAPKSVLNDLRRRAVRQLIELRESRARHAIACADALAGIRAEVLGGSLAHPPVVNRQSPIGDQLRLHILVRTLDQLRAIADCPSRPTTVFCEFRDDTEYARAAELAARQSLQLGLVTPRIITPRDESLLARIAERCGEGSPCGAVLVRNLASLSYLREHVPGVTLVGDASLNVANEITAATLIDWGLSRLTPAFELDERRLEDMIDRTYPAVFEIVLHQHVPMFHTAHCLFAANLSDGNDWPNCEHCGRPCRRHSLALRDRNRVDHPVAVDPAGRNTVYHAQPRSAMDSAGKLLRMGVRDFRIELLDESPRQMLNLISVFDVGRPIRRRRTVH